MVQDANPQAHTKPPLVMKGADRIEAINTKNDDRFVGSFYAWQVCRPMRRDFNLMTAKMYIISRKQIPAQRIALRLQELQSEVQGIVRLAKPYSLPMDATAEVLPIRIVSIEGRILYDALASVDIAMAKLIPVHGAEVTEEICKDFFNAYGRLKHSVFRPDHGERAGQDERSAGAGVTPHQPPVLVGIEGYRAIPGKLIGWLRDCVNGISKNGRG